MGIRRINYAVDAACKDGLTKQDLRNLTDPELARVTITMPSADAPAGSTVGDAIWVWPKEQVPGRFGKRAINFSTLAPYPILGMAVRRYVLAQLLFPLKRYSDLAGLQKRAHYVGRIAVSIGETVGDCKLESIDFSTLRGAYNKVVQNAPSLRATVIQYLNEINAHHTRGAIPDAFTQLTQTEHERLFLVDDGLPKRPVFSQDDAYGKYQPLPDEYVAAAGKIWSFYLDEILPNLGRLLQLAQTIETKVNGPRTRVWGGRRRGIAYDLS
jgi:hypothetical protein